MIQKTEASGRQRRQAEIFAGLHRSGDPLLLPNAWDVASAVTIARAGAQAIATTSAGAAWSVGVADGADLGADQAAAITGRIAAAVAVPISADIEAGYGPAPQTVAATVTAVIQAGAVGVNLEDRTGPADPASPPLFTPQEQAARLAAARAAADGLGIPLWINARTDTFLASTGATNAERLAQTFQRAEAYARAGADSLFVPGLIDLEAIARLAAGPLPVAVMAWAGAPSVAEFAAAGAVRISLGAAVAQAAYAVAARATAEILTRGTYDSTAGGIAGDAMNEALASSSAGRVMDSTGRVP
ncbi:MAG TPA: isocitrate lyase/phosphoenolpyruvate mutase family protein [Streptosporangiaceae bacterium]|jgi:2-methylisocitrate lyase-like PEP mutase family enzyme